MSIQNIAIENLGRKNSKPMADLFSTNAKELVGYFVWQCEKENVEPTYSYFELWMTLHQERYQEALFDFLNERPLSYPWS